MDEDSSQTPHFDYDLAFSRNIGWITDLEAQQLRTKKVAIAGMGGVGGFHLLTLTRLGIQNFNIADFDVFELQNFNRQIGAYISTLHTPKSETLARMAKDINPEANIKIFPKGVNDENLDEFLKDVDLYVDGLDFFVLQFRAKVYKRCHELGIPVVAAGPIGMGSAYFVFMPGHMTFEEYFRLDGLSDDEQRLNFLIGLVPHLLPFKYLVDQTTTNMQEKKGPSTVMACELCAGVAGVEALKVLLKRKNIYPAPYYHFFDAYLCKYRRGKIAWGNRNPLQIIKRAIVRKVLVSRKATKPAVYSMSVHQNDLEKILDISRWTPSGDNTQPWRFEIINANRVLIHVQDVADEDLYDFNGIATLLMCGMLLETISIAASHYGLKINYSYHKSEEHQLLFDVNLIHDDNVTSDALFPFIPYRSVDRYRYQLKPLSAKEKNTLQAAIGDEFELRWFESKRERFKMAKIIALSTDIRLRTPELYSIHKKIIDTEHLYSETGIPLNAVGLNGLSKHLMVWAMKNPERLNFLNKIGATYVSALELDIIPGIFSSAYFMLLAKDNHETYPFPEKLIRAGSALQRFWLTATKLGLVLQPAFASIAFAYYANQNIEFTKNPSLVEKAKKLADKLNKFSGAKNILFAGRIGYPASTKLKSRSIRMPLSKLLITK